MPRLDALQEYWKHNPPVHQLVAGYMGYKHEEPHSPAELFDMGVGTGKPEWLKTT